MNIDIEKIFSKAHQLQREGQLSQAVSKYEQVISLSPNHIEALRLLGLTFAELKDMPNAIVYLSKALHIDPNDASLHNNLATAYKKSHDLGKAIYHYNEALHLNPNYAQAHNNLGSIYAALGNFKQSLHHYRLAVHEAPDFTTAHYNLGLLLLRNNHLDAAIKQFNNVLALTPSHLDAQFYLGVLLLETNSVEKAECAFNAVLDVNSEHVEALVNLGVIAIKRSQGQIAIDYFTKALGFDNNNIDARNNLAATFIHHDRFENALMHYDVLLQKEPHNIEYLYNAGVAQMALGHLQEAIDHFETILSLQNNHFATLNNLAAVYIRLEQRDKAIELLERAKTANPTDEATQFMLHAFTGMKKNRAACPTYVSNLFNNYALYYDQHLQGPLNYTVPQQIGRLLHRIHCNTVKNAIDLGCGTGLCGAVLRELSEHLTGVDIAAKMLAEAKNKGIYDELIEVELIAFLQKNTNRYELAIAADVLPYLGDLDDLFAAIQNRLTHQGLFIFTHEISENEQWQLQDSARFSHHPEYIKHLCAKHGLTLIEHEKIVARQQNQHALEAMLYAVKLT